MFKKIILILLSIFILTTISIAEDMNVVGSRYQSIVSGVTYQLDFLQGPTGPCCSGNVILTSDNSSFGYIYGFQQKEGERLVTVTDVGYLYQDNQNKLTYIQSLSDLIFTSVSVYTTTN
jgi:hypothetical protein